MGDKSADKHDKMYFKANGSGLYITGNQERNIWTLWVEGMLMSDFGEHAKEV